MTAGEKSFAETKIHRDIFQGDALSPLLFVIAMMPLNNILKKCTVGYKLTKSQEKINHQMYMDDIKLFAKKGKYWKPKTRSEDIQLGHWDEIWYRKIHHADNKKRETTTDRMELPNQEKIWTIGEKESYKYLEILEANTIK